jgi:hypothetical protein
LTLKAELEIVLDLEPRYVNFGVVTRRAGATRFVDLVGPGAAETKPLSVMFKPLRIAQRAATAEESIVLVRLAEDSEAGAVELTLAPDAPSGVFDGLVVVQTDHPKVPELTARVRGTVMGDVTYRPQFLTFREIEEGTEQTRTLTLSSSGDDPVAVLEVGSKHPALTASFAEMVNGRTQITVTCNGAIRREREVSTLVVHTSSDEDPRLEVPVHMFRKKQSDPRPVRPPAAKQAPPPPTQD